MRKKSIRKQFFKPKNKKKDTEQPPTNQCKKSRLQEKTLQSRKKQLEDLVEIVHQEDESPEEQTAFSLYVFFLYYCSHGTHLTVYSLHSI